MSKYLVIVLICLYSSIAFSEERYETTYNLGMEKYISNNYERAVEYFLESLHLKPNSLTAYYIAQSFYQIKDYDEASFYARMALFELEPMLDKELRSYLFPLIPIIQVITMKENESYRGRALIYTFSETNVISKDLLKLAAIKEKEKTIKEVLNELLKFHRLNSNEKKIDLMKKEFD